VSLGTIISLGMGFIVLSIVSFFVYRRLPKRLKVDQYIGDWKELQAYCRDKATWPKALEEADHLLDSALKKRKYKGKSMGERMVSAQRTITDNDRLWFAHNLAKKVIAEPKTRLKETDVKNALVGFRQALRDIGALQPTESPVVEPESKKS
jgi:hypothetical protein